MPSHDYEEYIAALNAHGVRYLVVGAHAVAFHASGQATFQGSHYKISLAPFTETVRKSTRNVFAVSSIAGGTSI